MHNKAIIAYISIIFISFCSLVTIKFYASDLKEQVHVLEMEKHNEIEQIKVLKAELSFLSRADRLQYLATKYLGMNEAKNSKITTIKKEAQGKIQLIASGSQPIAITHKRVNWRYKDRNKILTTKRKVHKND